MMTKKFIDSFEPSRITDAIAWRTNVVRQIQSRTTDQSQVFCQFIVAYPTSLFANWFGHR